MPKIGMEPLRRAALISATISEIGVTGSLDVTVSAIAKRAGMSSALAHHYFGSKDEIFLAAMRHILSQYGAEIRARLSTINDPYERLIAIIDTSLESSQFDQEVVAAWLSFYVRAQKTPKVTQLLKIYSKRLLSNLRYNLRQLTNSENTETIAQMLASLIDGFYIRHALVDQRIYPEKMKIMIKEYVDLKLQEDSK